MKVLALHGYGIKLGAGGGALVVKSKEGSRKVPLGEVDMVLLLSSGISVTSKALRAMIASSVELVVLDARGSPIGILYHSHYTRTTETRRAQYLAYATGRELSYAKSFARCKLLSQAAAVWRLSTDLGERAGVRATEEIEGMIEELEGAKDKKEVMKVEARAAREYWSAIALLLPRELGFDGRDQDAQDPVNASLNYGYGILYSIAWRALVIAGLDPYAGFLHTDRSGKPVLAFDYVEMWRAPVVDEALVRAMAKGWRPRTREGLLEREDRLKIAELVNERLRAGCPGEGKSFEQAIKSYALSLASALRRSSPYKCYEGGRR
ncbi:MAG: CRISPR-associated endonuclease Cas1 [Acidilobaceae archaeon]|nr:CRISPR-associated endonuclease Cas1 [Acidilobaceae archaeon]